MDFEEVIEAMEREARKRNAPVFKYEDGDAFKTLVAAVLSSRTRDEVTSEAVRRLFDRVKSPRDLAEMSEEEIEELIRGVGFYRVKARKLKELAKTLVEKYDSKVPEKFEELIKLPGVGRKVANVVLSRMGKDVIAVDTHVHRIANRLGWVSTRKPEETEEELKKVVPKRLWRKLNEVFVGFGQTVCKPQKPICEECPVVNACKRVGV
ncbi:MAG: endonuclease III [Archaeoglobaceae archaeon]